MFIQAADIRIAEQHTATTVGLQPVLVRIDDDRIDIDDARERRSRILGEIVDQSEISAVSGIGVHAKTVLLAQRKDLG